MKVRFGFIWLRSRTAARSVKHIIEPSASVKSREFDYQTIY
jgi:hypothetical protein